MERQFCRWSKSMAATLLTTISAAICSTERCWLFCGSVKQRIWPFPSKNSYARKQLSVHSPQLSMPGSRANGLEDAQFVWSGIGKAITSFFWYHHFARRFRIEQFQHPSAGHTCWMSNVISAKDHPTVTSAIVKPSRFRVASSGTSMQSCPSRSLRASSAALLILNACILRLARLRLKTALCTCSTTNAYQKAWAPADNKLLWIIIEKPQKNEGPSMLNQFWKNELKRFQLMRGSMESLQGRND